ncbi:hypothetical protein J6590_071600 [Homalodisca vitripennis]|nr:hypothetical protein J6590_071600 [Homalodisca vitripennis]
MSQWWRENRERKGDTSQGAQCANMSVPCQGRLPVNLNDNQLVCEFVTIPAPLINNMRKVVKRYKCVGISAPQLGVDLRVMAMTCPDLDQFAGSPQEYQLKGMQPYSYSVGVHQL